MIGLKRHTVEVVEHQPGWAALAAAAIQEVRLAGADLLTDVQHVGSTAVPDLPAKPVLDIAAGMRTSEVIPEIVRRLTDIGYIYRGDGGREGGHLFVRESSPDIRTIHLHVVEYNGNQWKNYLFLRDLLHQDSEIRKQYAELKKQLRSRYPNGAMYLTQQPPRGCGLVRVENGAGSTCTACWARRKNSLPR